MHVSQNVMVKMSLMTSSVREAGMIPTANAPLNMMPYAVMINSRREMQRGNVCRRRRRCISKGTCEDTVCSLLFSIDYDNECAAECDGSAFKMVQRATCLYVRARIQS
eukprot:166064_1